MCHTRRPAASAAAASAPPENRTKGPKPKRAHFSPFAAPRSRLAVSLFSTAEAAGAFSGRVVTCGAREDAALVLLVLGPAGRFPGAGAGAEEELLAVRVPREVRMLQEDGEVHAPGPGGGSEDPAADDAAVSEGSCS